MYVSLFTLYYEESEYIFSNISAKSWQNSIFLGCYITQGLQRPLNYEEKQSSKKAHATVPLTNIYVKFICLLNENALGKNVTSLKKFVLYFRARGSHRCESNGCHYSRLVFLRFGQLKEQSAENLFFSAEIHMHLFWKSTTYKILETAKTWPCIFRYTINFKSFYRSFLTHVSHIFQL